jgi:hypothetical protein
MKISIGWVAAVSLASLPLLAQDRRDDGRSDSRSNDRRENERTNDGRQNDGRQTVRPNDGRQGARQGAPPTVNVGHGYVPAHGPPAVHVAPDTNRQPPRDDRGSQRDFRDQPQHPEVPHVHPQGDQWVGHNTGRNDARYRLRQPWAHGHFRGGFGPRYVYRIEGGNPERFDLDGQFFAVAQADLPLVSDWDFDDDDIVLYADPDHDGYYLAYDTRLGTYVHVEYLGQ